MVRVEELVGRSSRVVCVEVVCTYGNNGGRPVS